VAAPERTAFMAKQSEGVKRVFHVFFIYLHFYLKAADLLGFPEDKK